MNSLRSILLGLTVMMLSGRVQAQSLTPSNKPNRTQKALIERGYGMFIHYGMNTFIQQEWSDGTAPATTYNPTHLDPDQWVRVARDAGFRYVLLVTKHHDGFCLWDSKFTNYDIASSPVPTDVVGAVSAACRKYGIGFAVYYSLWDRHEPSYRDQDFNKYVDYMENQLTELMTQYGEVCELWLDGAWDRPVADWQLSRLYSLVKHLQPHCAFGVNHNIGREDDHPYHTDATLVPPYECTQDNQFFMRLFPSDFRLWDPRIASIYDHKQYLHHGESYYLPFEHTICLSKAWNWFQKDQPMETRDLDELQELFYLCTANDNTLVVNIPPDQTGQIRENEANTAIALAQRLGIRRGKPLPKGPRRVKILDARASTEWDKDYSAMQAVDGAMDTRWASTEKVCQLVLTPDSKTEWNKIVIFEYQEQKQAGDGFSNYRVNRIQRYTIDILENGEWNPIYVSTESMGDCKVIHLPRKYRGQQVRLHVLQAIDAPSIYEIFLTSENKR